MKYITLPQRKVAVVDDKDYGLLLSYKWRLGRSGANWYARASQNYQELKMHRMILGLRLHDGIQVDHINHDGLDNRRCNLRTCCASENQMNQRAQRKKTSIYKGVFWDKNSKKWRAQIVCRGNQEYIGLFSIEEQAARAYDEKAKVLFGNFSCGNFT